MAVIQPSVLKAAKADGVMLDHTLFDEERGYGVEMCPDPYCTNAALWRVTNNGTVTDLGGGFPVEYSSAIEAQAGDGTHDRLEQNSDVTGYKIDAYYRVKALVNPLSNSGADQGFFAFQFTNGSENVQPVGLGWQWLETTVKAKYTTGRTRVYVCRAGGNTNDRLQVAYLSIKEVL